jgi:hypothetical protein
METGSRQDSRIDPKGIQGIPPPIFRFNLLKRFRTIATTQGEPARSALKAVHMCADLLRPEAAGPMAR